MQTIADTRLYLDTAYYILAKFNVTTETWPDTVSEHQMVINDMNQLLLGQYEIEPQLDYRDPNESKYWIETIIESYDSVVARADSITNNTTKKKYLFNHAILQMNEIGQRLSKEMTSTTMKIVSLDKADEAINRQTKNALEIDNSFELEFVSTEEELVKHIAEQQSKYIANHKSFKKTMNNVDEVIESLTKYGKEHGLNNIIGVN